MTPPARPVRRRTLVVVALALALPLGALPTLTLATEASAATPSPQLTWSTVASSADLPPGSTRHFNSFNQPSVNESGLVVFRARTQGPEPPVRGVYTATAGGDVTAVAQAGDTVPAPNNSDATFNEFPSFPRIDATSAAVVTRAQSTPVYTNPADGTKLGTSGVYSTVGGTFGSGATMLGAMAGFEKYAVPGEPAGTRFDQFPGAPAVDGTTIVFKGNYAVGTTSRTGVFFRDVADPDAAVGLIAATGTPMPGGHGATFGSTAPPSAAGGRTVFSGWDNEESPTAGGIYLAVTQDQPSLTKVVGIGDAVPGQSDGATFTNVGEGLSFDGRFVAFWGSWGSETREITLACVTDGNKARLAFCQQQYPNGFTTSVPVHQGFFVADTDTGEIHPVTTSGPRFTTFQFWVFSGRVPGMEGGEEDTLEVARWRSSSFIAVTGLTGGAYQVAFKATPVSGGSGIYVGQGPSDAERIVTAFDTSTPGTVVDPAAPAGSLVTAVGVERDGFRGRWLAVNASMLDPVTSASWAGVYVARVPSDLAMQSQTVEVVSVPPTDAQAGGSYAVSAVADSGLPVTLSLDPATTDGACTLSGSTVRFVHQGTCVVDADQPGDAAYQPATRVQQTIAVAPAVTTVAVAAGNGSVVYGQMPQVTATVTSGAGTPTGSVQFAVDGAPLGAPVPLAAGAASGPALVGAGGAALLPGSHEVTATFTPADPAVHAASLGSTALVVAKASTSVTLTVTPSTLVARVAVTAPGSAPTTGSVLFLVAGVPVGEAPLVDGVATLAYVVPAGSSQLVAAAYVGTDVLTGASVSLARHDPTIEAVVTSPVTHTGYGWYRSPVTVTFRCTATSAPLTTPCPEPVTFGSSGAALSLTRTIGASDGGVATVVVGPVNVDLGRPSVSVGGVANRAVYYGVAPTPRCVGTDTLSGIAKCVVTRSTVRGVATYQARAVDKAGNEATVTGAYTLLDNYVAGARYVKGAFVLSAGHRYTLVVVGTKARPVYFYAAAYPRTPTRPGQVMAPAGPQRWTTTFTVTTAMRSRPYWNIGVKVGGTLRVLRIHVV